MQRSRRRRRRRGYAPPPSVLFTTGAPRRRGGFRLLVPVTLAGAVIVSPLLAPAPARQAVGEGDFASLRAAVSQAASQALGVPPAQPRIRPEPAYSPVRWRRSEALGLPYAGRLVDGVQLPAAGAHYYTWDFPLRRSPSRGWRRWGTARLVHTILRVTTAYAREHPHAPKLGIADLSRPQGGPFGSEFGGLGHNSHQNGLDVDVLYPLRRTRRLGPPHIAAQIDHRRAQDLVDLFVRAGAQFVFVGPHTGLHGPAGVVQVLQYHDDHMHVRIP